MAGSHAKDAKGAKERDNRSRAMGQTSLARGTPQVDDVGFGRKIVPSLRPWRPLRELACGEEADATAGSHAKERKGRAKERDNRPRVMGQTSLARGTSQVDEVGFGRKIAVFFAALASFA